MLRSLSCENCFPGGESMSRSISISLTVAALCFTLASCSKKQNQAGDEKGGSGTPVKPPYTAPNPAPDPHSGVKEDATRKLEKSATMQLHLDRFLRGKGYDFKKYNLNVVRLKNQK